MMNAHWVVGSDRSVNERPVRFSLAQLAALLKGFIVLPEFQNVMFLRDEINFVGYLFECHQLLLSNIHKDNGIKNPSSQFRDEGRNNLRGTTQIPAGWQTLVCNPFAILLQTVSVITEDKPGSLTLQNAFQFTLRKDLLLWGLSRLTPTPGSLSIDQKHTRFRRRFDFLNFGIMPPNKGEVNHSQIISPPAQNKKAR
jgi:hypothetical protein